MRIIERHIASSIIKIFISTAFVFCLLYILIDTTSTLDEIIDRKVPFSILVEYYLSYIPLILIQTSPIACLIATLFTFGALNNNNEIIVMRASGLNFWQITKPAICFGLIVSALIFWINEKYVPDANSNLQKIRLENMILKADRDKRQKAIKNLTFYGKKNRLYFIDTFNPQDFELNGITIIEHDNNANIEQKIVALNGKWTGIAWKFFQCQVTSYEPGEINVAKKIKVYPEKLMDSKMETPEDFLKQRLDVNSMNIKQLHEYIKRFSNSGAVKALNNLRVDLHQKIASPFGNFVIILVGLPFALIVRSRKRSTFTSLGIAILIGFLFYVANAVALALGKGGLFPPILSAWIVPVIFTGVAIALIETYF
ncbi:MAG: LptF/LptG family permease [Candidatus Omnitrophica bacterium]|nr:LptF/LptG family permease [Candidatus Omnitrophota bacterium]MBU1997002.1 LptF/LptG family permease [Candidatus Omnitrophota bacterium]